MRNIKTLLVFCLAFSFLSCDRNDKMKKDISEETVQTKIQICPEHQVSEDKCTRCNPSLIPEFKAKGDWCAEHNLPESQCAICNPSLKKELKQTVTIGNESQNLIGLKLSEVTYRALEETLMVTGEIASDTEKMYHILPEVPGKVIEVKVKLGNIVKKGQVLAVIRSAKTDSIEDIVSPYSGMIIGENISAGIRVDEITSIFTIADLSTMWANFDVYEKDIGKVMVGQSIKVKSIAYPGKNFNGKIIFISPGVDKKSRTIKVRAAIINKAYLLKFNMFVTGHIIISKKGKYLTIPSNAVQSLKEKEIVFVLGGNNEFTAREVKISFRTEQLSQVSEGLSRGEMVVTDGSFLLKSELLKSELGAGCAE